MSTRSLKVAVHVTKLASSDTFPITGVLTKTLLATKKHLEDVPTGLPDSEKVATISEAQRKKERELVRKEVERLQGSIQSLCQAANPLGKIMDYVQV